MRTKNFKHFAIALAVVAVGLTGYSVAVAQQNPDMNNTQAPDNPGGSGGGGNDCNLCKVKHHGITVFSCRPMDGESCSDSYGDTSVSCVGAKKC